MEWIENFWVERPVIIIGVLIILYWIMNKLIELDNWKD